MYAQVVFHNAVTEQPAANTHSSDTTEESDDEIIEILESLRATSTEESMDDDETLQVLDSVRPTSTDDQSTVDILNQLENLRPSEEVTEDTGDE